MRPTLRVVALLLSAGAAAACAASTPDEAAPSTTATTTIAPTTTIAAVDVRARFVETAGTEGALRDLSADDLGCVADELAAVATTEVVLSIGLNGPRPHQAEMVVGALDTCGVVEAVFRTGMAPDPGEVGLPQADPDCVLDGVSDDQLAPILVAQFARPGGVTVDGGEMEAMLAGTPIMSNLLRCTLAGSGELSPFCDGYLEVLDDVLRLVFGSEALGAAVDPVAYAELYGVVEGVFAWLATNVDPALRGDAVLVHDGVIVVAEAFAEAAEGMDPADPEASETALLAATTRLGAGLEAMDAADLPVATTRLRSHVGDSCGMQSTIVFDLFGGFGAAFVGGG